ncbi:MAG TPA: class I adenylate-forming enzyme family protein [Candidatus Saccharimonadales bacterium]|nr:class I adenylate-forming enzyme family protein [Candidatus Saccharimonadales bacterium]
MALNAQKMADKPALVYEDEMLDWAELWRRVQKASSQVGKYLRSKKQCVVALLLTNSTDFVASYLAVVHKGHIAFPIDPAYKKLEIDAMVEELDPKIIITSKDYLGKLSKSDTPILLAEELTNGDVEEQSLLRLEPDKQTISLTFTSGTTGTPKVVPNTHSNQIWTIEVCSKVWSWTENDSLLISIPLSHWYGIVLGIGASLYHGNTLYLLDQRFDPQKTLKLLASGKVTIYQHISILYQKLLEAKGDYDLSKVRLCISGGAPLPPEVWRAFKRRFGKEILETYGSSETGRIAANRVGEKPVLGSPGKILPGVNMRFSKDNEVLIKSPGVFPGYYKNLRATEAAFTEDGYFNTGDIGELKNKALFLKGRRQEQIRRFGYTISPRDVEWAMHQHKKVKDIYVMGHQRAGQPNDELIYFLVGDISEQEVKDYCKTNMLFAWRPDKIILLSGLPRTRSGKAKIPEFKRLIGQQV